MRPLRIATRKSPLARWQAEWVQKRLEDHGIKSELVLLSSEGDTHRQVIDGSQAVGLFTKRIQQAVLEGEADLAVHSLKDLPTQVDRGLTLAAVPPRAEVADCIISNHDWSVETLPEGAQVGTGSRRRAAQLRHLRSDLKVVPIRGNVQTRLSHLDLPDFHAVILAQAGLERLGLSSIATRPIPLDLMLPAPGQGALGIETRRDDSEAIAAVSLLNDPITQLCTATERALLRELKAGCLAPVAGLATLKESTLRIEAVVLSVDGHQRLSVKLETVLEPFTLERTKLASESAFSEAESLGINAANALLQSGAAPLIADAR